MNKVITRSIFAIIISVLLAFFIAKMNEPYVQQFKGQSLYFWAAILAFTINWIVFIPSYIFQTEHYFDLIGSLTFLSILIFVFIGSAFSGDYRAMILFTLPTIWTLRLGIFLFTRIQNSGSDTRFDAIKPVFFRFLTAWTLQGLWAYLTLSAAIATLASTKTVPIDAFAFIGSVIWILGFSIEVIADRQKTLFKKDKANNGKFISSGLWAYSRHPNYFGEILLWSGIFVICIPVLEGSQWVTIISPIFVFILLKYVSGINMLEKIADKRWGGQADYEQYKQNTSELIPLP